MQGGKSEWALLDRRTVVPSTTCCARIAGQRRTATEARNRAAGTAQEHQAMLDCSEIMRIEREKHISMTRSQIRDMNPSSKQFWSKNRELLGEPPKTCNIPALKDEKTNI